MRMTIKEVANDMECTEQFVRVAIQRGVYPFGQAIKQSSVYTYYINRERYMAWKEGKL